MGAWIDYNCWIIRRFYVSGVGWIVEYQCLCPTDPIGEYQTQIKEPYTTAELDTDVLRLMARCPEEKAKACKVSSEPSSSKNVDVGVNVPVKLVIKNCGMVAAPMGSSIEKDGVEIVGVYKDMVNPGGTFEISTSFSMPNNVTNLKFEGYAWVNGAWSLDVNFTYTLTPIIGEAKGEITLCNINGSSCPKCGQANQGDEISVIAEMKNVGTEKGKFMFYVLDQHGNELSKAGGIGYKDVDAGETWKVTPASWDDLDFKMPSEAIIEGHLKLARLE